MGVFQNNLMGAAAAAASAGGGDFYSYQIANSIRGSAADDRTLQWTAGTPTSADTFTMSYWVKRQTTSTTDSANNIFVTGTSGGAYFYISFGADLAFEGAGGNWSTSYLNTNAAYRDTSAWYHHILVFDSTESAENDRLKIYINGERITSFSQDSMHGNIGASEDFSFINASGVVQAFGGLSGKGHGTEGADLSLADVMFFDGQAYYSELGETKNGVWIPKDPSGLTFGNNGYYLKFESSGDLGNDSSGNNNDFTNANFETHDQMTDSPTFGDEGSANFATYGPLWKTPDMTFSEGNLQYTTSTNQRGCMSNWEVPLEGKWYWEYTQVSWAASDGDSAVIGVNVATVDFTASRGGNPTAYAWSAYDGAKVINGTESSYGDSWRTGDVLGVAVDRVNDTIQFYKNGSGQGTFSIPSTGDLFPWFGSGGGTSSAVGKVNFGADSSFGGQSGLSGTSASAPDENGYGDFYDTPPSGFLAMCAGNLPTAEEIDPAETDDNYPQKQFNMLQYTGNGSERTLTTQFQIDMSWARSTIQGQGWYALDTSRGFFGASSNNKYLKLDTTDDEDTLPQYNFKAQSGNDITLTDGTWFNSGSHTQQMWYWKGNGGTTSTPAGGSLATTVQVNTASGFSIIQYVGDGGTSNFTLAHGLGKKPNMVLMKDRDTNGNNNQFHCFPVNTPLTANTYFYTSSADAAGTSTNGTISNTATTDTVIGVNRTSSTGGGQTISESGDNFLMYAFANIEGYSKFSSYVGNSNANGPFVYCGFRPAFIAIKDMGTANEWRVFDTLNNSYNVSTEWLVLNSDAAISTASTTNDIDILSNGFKIRGTAGNTNIDGTNYFFMAWAENPFQYATAR